MTLNIPRPEYPRPRLVREDNWINLNGEWQFEIDNGDSGKERQFFKRDSLNGKIIVPFVPESKLSGIENTDFMKAVWYRREFSVPNNWDTEKGRVIVNFGAVDYLCEVWINGEHAGKHKGGYTPFSFDITSLLQQGINVITVYAFDDTKSDLQPSGKQSMKYNNWQCFYTRCTGIWQTVWLEYVPKVYVDKIKITPDIGNESIHVAVKMNTYCSESLKVKSFLEDKEISSMNLKISGKEVEFTLSVPNPSLWFPESPVLYDLEIEAGKDKVKSYFGMRKVSIDGYKVLINDKSVFQRLVLDQGYYPDGIYTAPSDEALKEDILLSKKIGFNGARMHMKVFEPRFSYWADKLGYLLWAEYPNWGLYTAKIETLSPVLTEWIETMERDYNSPAIIGWCPFNESSWGTLQEIYDGILAVTRLYDKMRPVIDSSGYFHGNDTDIYDVHDYIQDPEEFKKVYEPFKEDDSKAWQNFPAQEGPYKGQPYFVSEFGGTWWSVDENGDNGWGYGDAPKTLEEFYQRYEDLVNVLLNHPKMFGFCYTQLTDVFQEKNGLFTFDRKEKFDSDKLYNINTRQAEIEK